MIVRKRSLIVIISVLIILLGGGFVFLDWSRFFQASAYMTYEEAMLSRCAKLSVSFLCALLAWVAGKDCLCKRDGDNMKVIFLFIFLADVLLSLRLGIQGGLTFGLVQILLSIRHARGLKNFVTANKGGRALKAITVKGLAVLALLLILLLFVFLPLLKGKLLLYMATGYGILMGISLWSALTAPVIEIYPKTNSTFIAAGMLLFFLCDLCVGLSIALKPGIYRMIAQSLTWIFYTPALYLLALSVYDFEKLKSDFQAMQTYV